MLTFSQVYSAHGKPNAMESLVRDMTVPPKAKLEDQMNTDSLKWICPKSAMNRTTLLPGKPRKIQTQNVNNEAQQGYEIGLVSLSSGEGPRYIGPSSGYFFARCILPNSRCPVS